MNGTDRPEGFQPDRRTFQINTETLECTASRKFLATPVRLWNTLKEHPLGVRWAVAPESARTPWSGPDGALWLAKRNSVLLTEDGVALVQLEQWAPQGLVSVGTAPISLRGAVRVSWYTGYPMACCHAQPDRHDRNWTPFTGLTFDTTYALDQFEIERFAASERDNGDWMGKWSA